MSPVEYGHRTASICRLGKIAMRLKREIHWNPDREELLNDEEATKLMSRQPRAPWAYG